MATFNTYQPTVEERPIARKWFIAALIISLMIHAVLLFLFRATKLEHFSRYTERLVPRAFTSIGRVNVDAKLLDPEPEHPEKPKSGSQEVANIDVPFEKPSVETAPDEVVYKPTAPDLVKPIMSEKPKVDSSNLNALAKMQQSTAKDLDKDLDSLREQLIKDKPKVGSSSLLKLADAAKSGEGNSGGNSGIPGTKSLDEALSGTGSGLHSGDKIGIRGGALFEYDKVDLRPEATEALRKLAIIVKRYPNAIFTIEGYADSFGSADYNLLLSERRAEAVKAWLLVNIGINPFKIEAKGYGSTKFVVQPSGSDDEQEKNRQEKNRRVEIGVKFPGSM